MAVMIAVDCFPSPRHSCTNDLDRHRPPRVVHAPMIFSSTWNRPPISRIGQAKKLAPII